MEPYLVNYATFFETRLIDEKGTFIPTIHIKKAKELAKEANLDLVCFNSPSGNDLALCKIIDWPKFKYQKNKLQKKERQDKKAEIKEMRFAPVISEHDMEYKVNQIIDFLKDEMEVVVVMRFRGIHHRMVDEGLRIVNEIVDKCKPFGEEKHRKKDNNNISVRLVAVKK